MAVSDFSRYRLMTPGPVPMSEASLRALGQPMIHHRTPEFTEILLRVLLKLKSVLGTTQPVMMHVSTGSGGMEPAIVNTLSPGDEILCVVSGKFGERWEQIARAYGIVTQILTVPWGEAVAVGKVKDALYRNPNIKAVLCQASETSTAVLHPIQKIAELVKCRPNTLFMVDAITAIGATPMPMDEWGLDVVVAGSQKAFMIPTGLSFVALSKKAWEFQKQATCPRFYFDLETERKANEKGQTFFSSAVSHVRALDVALDDFTGEGLVRSIARSHLMSKALAAGVGELGLSLFAKVPTPAVTAINVPDEVDGKALPQHIEQNYNITVMGGQDELQGKIVRVGHLGPISDEDLVATVEALGLSLIDLGWPSMTPIAIERAREATIKILNGAN